MATNYPPGVTGTEPQITGICEYCGDPTCGEENICPDRGEIVRREASEAEAAGMDKLAVLDAVASLKGARDRATSEYVEAVREAHKHGASIREIAEAAGYDSHSAIQKILTKQN